MVKHTCHICNKEFKRNIDLVYHLEKKKNHVNHLLNL